MSTSAQDEQSERRRVFAQDQSLRSGTFHQHAVSDAQIPGRFSAFSATVIGAKPDVAGAYPAASAAHQTALPPEEPLGYSVDVLEPLGLATEAQGNSGDAVVAPSSTTPLVDDVERTASSLSPTTDDLSSGHISQPSRHAQRALRSSPSWRRF